MGLIEKAKARWQDFMHNAYLQEKFNEIIFGTDTVQGKLFDVVLIVGIITSVLIVMIDSLPEVHPIVHDICYFLEWIFTVFFTAEYLMRLYCAPDRRKYIFSVFGIIDLLAFLPTYLSLFFRPAHILMVIRVFRLIRVFRIFRLFTFMREGQILMNAIKDSFHKLFVFFSILLLVVISLGALMYIVECGEPDTKFVNIPVSIYWSVVTITTVGYGDIAPVTILGKMISILVMLLGYTVIAVPTGVVSSSMIDGYRHRHAPICPYCGKLVAKEDAKYCKYCGRPMDKKTLSEYIAKKEAEIAETERLRREEK